MKNRTPALLAVSAANIIYGLNYVIAKGIMPDFLHPRAIIFLRVFFATLVFWIVSLFLKKDKVEPKDLKLLFIASFFGISLNQLMFFEGLNLSNSINASILSVGIPIAVLIFSRIIHKFPISISKLIGMSLGTLGAVYLILGYGNIDLSGKAMIGNIFILINVTSYSLFLVLIKPLTAKYRPITIMKWIFLFGFIVVLPITVPKVIQSDWTTIPVNIWFSILYVIFFATILAYLFNNYSLTRMSAFTNSAFIYSQPAIATMTAVFFGKEQIHIQQIVAAVLIFAGVYFVIRQRKKVNEI
ncbi:MAG: EamA family transporter [Bacteroidales bacterium]|nr:EamA family transporter [Bacteroidales bacterium]